MKKLLLILLCLPMIGFGQTSWTHCDSSFSININSQNSIEVVYSVSGPNLNMNSNPSWVYFNMLGSCIGGSSYNSQTDTVNINNNFPDSTAIMCLISDSLSSCIVTDTLVFDSLSGWYFTSNVQLINTTYDCDLVNGCYDPGTGLGAYTLLSACQSNCIIPTTYDCDLVSGCYDPGTGLGTYASLSACQSNCIVSSTNELSGIISRKLMKIVDVYGREINTLKENQTLFYIYDDGTVEKKIIIE